MTSGNGFKIAGLHHIQLAIPAGQEETCRRFWGKALGLAELPKPAGLAGRGGCWFGGGGLEVHLGVDADFAPARKAHPGILVTGLDELAAALEAAGATVTWDTELDGHDRFYSSDPFGNRLEFLQPKRLTQAGEY